MTLRELPLGHSAVVTTVGGKGALRQHFLDMGVIPGSRIKLVKYAPLGDPMELLIHGYELTLRLDDAAKIGIDNVCDTPFPDKERERKQALADESHHTEHPGLGETGRFHCKSEEHPLPKTEKLTFALIGNQNTGKTTLFNQLTGANQHVGNFPGVTVDQKSGSIKGYPDTLVTDLPGIYSLSPYSNEEIVSRRFVLEQKPTCIINIIDATNIVRNLYLTMQLLELGIPMVIALNMIDEVDNNGGTIRINEMEGLLGVPVIPISASKNEGVRELVEHAVHVARYQESPLRQDFCRADDNGGAVHRCLHAIMHFIEDHAAKAKLPVRFAATKLLEQDPLVLEALALSDNERATVRHILRQLEEERQLDPAAALADMRFSFITDLADRTVVEPLESKERARSRKMDSVLTGKWTAIPVFLAIMSLIFYMTFDGIGAILQGWLETGIDNLTVFVDTFFKAAGVNAVIHSLVLDGVFQGVGSVLSFMPVIVILFFFLSILEDSGYMARIAFVMDKLLRKIGLSGRSIVPLLIGFGCSVPGVMASRTLPSERDRRLTVLLTPFMSCTAKLPIYAFFSAAFFPDNAAVVMISLYLIGIVTGIVVALLFKKTLFRGEAVPFVMELPNYRMPGWRNVTRLLWDKSRDFIMRAFTVIFMASIVIWFLQTFDFQLHQVEDSHDSMLASVAGLISPLFEPLGFGDWRVTTSLLSGFMAKESVVSTITVVFGSVDTLLQTLTVSAAFALLVFCLLYTPCVAAVAAIRRELGSRYALGVVVGQCVLAWIVAFLAYTLFNMVV